jgi:nitroimidazol reductase NimA-like FMN-containing flavoprotein (pyridoxamine 5'-phosphate oxidase superfamily)
MTFTSASLTGVPFTRDECLRLLDKADVARVLLSVKGLPAALPARIETAERDRLVISSRENAVLLAARRGEVISLQIDGLSDDDRTWSVTVTGIASAVPVDGPESERFKRRLGCGATLVILPLSLVAGHHEH